MQKPLMEQAKVKMTNIHLVVRVEVDGKEVFETERSIDWEILKKETGAVVVLQHPNDIEDIALDALNKGEDVINQSPELWQSN